MYIKLKVPRRDTFPVKIYLFQNWTEIPFILANICIVKSSIGS